jgi:hypothetical protein
MRYLKSRQGSRAEPAAVVLQAQESEKEQQQQQQSFAARLLRRLLANLPKFTAFAALSFLVAVNRSSTDRTEFFVSGGGTTDALTHLTEHVAALASASSEALATALVDEMLEDLDALQTYAATNDAVKAILCTPTGNNGRLLCHQLLDLALAPFAARPALVSKRQWSLLRLQAALVLERCCMHADGANSNLPIDIALALVGRNDLRGDVRRSLTTALANASLHASAPQASSLVAAGALRAFFIAEENPLIKLHLYGRGGERLARLAVPDAVPPADGALVPNFAARRVLPSSPLLTPIYDVLDQGMNSLFIYTGCGGVLWGAAVALYRGLPRSAVINNALRTGAVSTCIPLYFMGLLLNFYVHSRKRLDTAGQLIALDTLMLASLYPAFPLVRTVDRAFPFWVGGHIVGFAGYFLALVYRGDDMLRHAEERARQAPQASK